MNCLLFDHPSTITQDELMNDILLLPEWRRKKAMSYRFLIDQVLCTKAYLLLQRGLIEYYGIDEELIFEYVGNGKPVLRGYPDIHFNLSHCKRSILCVIDNRPVGCDIEEIETKLDLDLCRKCLNDKEISYVLSSTDPCLEFTKLWTMKESYLKLKGDGINDNIAALFTRDLLDGITLDSHICMEKGYVYSICKFRDASTD